MKKIVLITGILLLGVGFYSCKDKNPIDCAQRNIEVINAAEEYGKDQSSENCVNYKNAINDYLECDIVTTTQRETYEAVLKTLDC